MNKVEVAAMKNRTLRSFITWLIIASPLWWTGGCYTYQKVTKLDEAVGSEIEVVTKGNNAYTFKRWSSDGSGGVSGEAECIVPSSYSLPVAYAKRHLTLPIDSIKNISTKASNTGGNLVAATFITVVLVGGLVCLVVSSIRLGPFL